MVIAGKLIALAAVGALATGSAAITMTCCPTETISCLDGHPSFFKASCNIQALGGTTAPKQYKQTAAGIPTGFSQMTLKCPTGEKAISGGFRYFDLTKLGEYTMKEVAPLAPSGNTAIGYQFIARTNAFTGGVFKVYITCEGH